MSAPPLTTGDILNQDSVIHQLQQQQRVRNGNEPQQQTDSQYGRFSGKVEYTDMMMIEDSSHEVPEQIANGNELFGGMGTHTFPLYTISESNQEINLTDVRMMAEFNE